MTASVPELTVLILAMNEAETLRELLPKIRETLFRHVRDHEILVVDGGSQDETVEIAQQAQARVIFQQKPGYGNAYRQGLAAALGHYILTIDADGSHPIEIFEQLWPHRNDYDVVMGSRYLPNSSDGRTWLRKSMSRVLNLAYSQCLSIPLTDISGGFRLYRAEAIQQTPCYGKHYEAVAELMVRLYGKGFRTLEIPYHYTSRQRGSSKARVLFFGLYYAWTLLRLWAWLRLGRFPILQELAGLLFSGLLAITMTETYLRTFSPQELMTPAYDDRMGMRTFLPNIRIRHRSKDFDVIYKTNSLGLRGKDYPFQKPPGTYRIITLGPSYTFGSGVNEEESYAYLLEKQLNASSRARRVELVNLGWGGTPINFHEFLYREMGSRYHPDLLVIHIQINSMGSLKDEYTLPRTTPLTNNIPSKTARIRWLVRHLPGYHYLCEHSHLWALKRKALALQVEENETTSNSPITYDPESALAMQRNYIQIFNVLVNEACSKKTQVVALKDKRVLEPFPLIEKHMRAKALRNPCFSLLDLDIRTEHLFPSDPHWNPKGHRFAADQLFKFIQAIQSHAFL